MARGVSVGTFLAALLAVGGVLFLLVTLAVWSGEFLGWGDDFGAYYSAIQRYAATGSPYDAGTVNAPVQPGQPGLFLYSPVLVILLLPLGALPLSAATWVFEAFRLAILGATCALMPVSPRLRLAVLGIACLSPAVLNDFKWGNISLILTLLAVVAWRFMDRPLAAGAIAAAISLRLTMGLFALWWLVRAQWRALRWLVASAAILFLVTLPFIGLRGWLDYAAVVRNLAGFEAIGQNVAFGALVERVTGSALLGSFSLFAGYAVAVVAVLFSLRRDREVSFVVTLGATLMLSPLLWEHYLANLLVTAAFVASRGRLWGLALPLLCWLPRETLPLVALLATVVPFTVEDRGEPAWRRRPAVLEDQTQPVQA